MTYTVEFERKGHPLGRMSERREFTEYAKAKAYAQYIASHGEDKKFVWVRDNTRRTIDQIVYRVK